jgi:hypothetical protein
MQPESEVIADLLGGPRHRFADPLAVEVPTSGAGVYTVWMRTASSSTSVWLGGTQTARDSPAGCEATPAVGEGGSD